MPLLITQGLWPARFIDQGSRNIIFNCLKEFNEKSLKPAPNTEQKMIQSLNYYMQAVFAAQNRATPEPGMGTFSVKRSLFAIYPIRTAWQE